jgi:hypothetical protein
MWINIDDQIPEEGQKVFYYFDVFDKVYRGTFTTWTVEDMGTMNCFCGCGWLCDDVIWWMPDEGQEFPNKPRL